MNKKNSLVGCMEKYGRILLKSGLIVVISAIVGLLLLVAVFAIPVEQIEHNVASSAEIFQEEGTYPTLNIIRNGSKLDNWTDALMLLIASYQSDTSILDQAITIYRPSITGENPAEIIVSHYIEGEEVGSYSYARYWHGYLIFLKPLLTILTYGQIRNLNAVLVVISFALMIILMWRREMKRYIVPYILALLFIDPFAVSKSLQFSSIYYIYTIASIIFLYKKDWFTDREDRILLFFVITGCVTSYFDFLTYPLVTYGIPAILYLCSTKKSLKDNFRLQLLTLIAWGVGYVGMWASKWILATILGNSNIIMNALSTILTRSSSTDQYGNAFSVLEVIKKQFMYAATPLFWGGVFYVAVTFVYSLCHNLRKKMQDFTWINYIFICVLPFVWYVGASNHSYIHAWMTYRELMIAVFSIMCMFARYATKTEKDT